MRSSLALLLAATLSEVSAQEPRFDLPRDTVLLDEKIAIRLTNLPPNRLITLQLLGSQAEGSWVSSATYLSDREGHLDLDRMAPIAGSYSGVDPMGLFWSAELDSGLPRLAPSQSTRLDPAAGPGSAQPWELRAESEGGVLATDTVWRRAVSPDVRVTLVREQGLLGTFYHRQQPSPTPGIIVLSGAGGGLPSAAQQPGGLASRGFAVLSLAYFAAEGLPPQLSGIELEYFKRAIDWLGARPGVDSKRIGVVGTSRGGELGLLLGSVFPEVKAVAAYVPSHVVWGGCCDSTAQAGPSWTYKGKPIAHMPPAPEIRAAVRALKPSTPIRRTPLFRRRLEDTIAAARSAIPVERINGPVLLISGREDQAWPSFFMAERIATRLRRYGFQHAYRHLAYSGAGHSIGRPYESTMDIGSKLQSLTNRPYDSGGTPSGTARASEDSWLKVLDFLERYLRRAQARQNR